MTCSDKTMLTWVESPAAGSLNPEPLIANFRRLAKKELNYLGLAFVLSLTLWWVSTQFLWKS